MSAWRKIQDCEATICKTDANLFVDPYTTIVRSAVTESLIHRKKLLSQELSSFSWSHPKTCYAAHIVSFRRFDFVSIRKVITH
jgi:hypothetical protein